MLYLLLGIILVASGVVAVLLYQRALARINSSNPEVWEKAIRAFEVEDRPILLAVFPSTENRPASTL